jgi:tetratricopeptide (TPR) repeat protein
MQRAQALAQDDNCGKALPIFDRVIPSIPAENVASRSQGYLDLGKCLLVTERPGDALTAFQHAADLDPNNLDARLELGSLLVLGGLPQEAVPIAEYVDARKPGDARALALLAAIAQASGQPGEAERLYRTAFDADNKRPEIALAFAEVLNRANKTQQALDVLQQAATASNDAQLWLALGRFAEHQGDVPAAERAYRAAVQAKDTPENNLRLAQFLQRLARTNEAEAILRHVDELQPARVSALADFLVSAGRADDALTSYVRRLFGDQSRPADPERTALVARMIEAELESAGSTDHARIMLHQNASYLPAAEQAALRAQIALRDGAMAEAEREADSAVAADSSNAAAQYVRGLVLWRMERSGEASATWVRALESDPGHIGSRLMLAKHQLAADQLEGAEHAILPAVRAEPANLRVLDVYARILLARGRVSDAKAIWARTNTIAPGQLTSKLLAGEIALAEKNLAAALIMFQRAATEFPDSAEAVDGLLRVYRYGRFTRPMLRNVEKIAAAPPASAALMEITGRLYAEQGWTDDALRALRQAASLRRSSSLSHQPDLLAALGAHARGDAAAAVKAYESALQRGTLSRIAANNLAWLYAEQGRNLDRALELAQEARAGAPEDPAVLDTLGYVLLQRRQFSDAIPILREAMRTAGAAHRHIIQAHLEQAYAGTGTRPPAHAIP